MINYRPNIMQSISPKEFFGPHGLVSYQELWRGVIGAPIENQDKGNAGVSWSAGVTGTHTFLPTIGPAYLPNLGNNVALLTTNATLLSTFTGDVNYTVILWFGVNSYSTNNNALFTVGSNDGNHEVRLDINVTNGELRFDQYEGGYNTPATLLKYKTNYPPANCACFVRKSGVGCWFFHNNFKSSIGTNKNVVLHTRACIGNIAFASGLPTWVHRGPIRDIAVFNYAIPDSDLIEYYNWASQKRMFQYAFQGLTPTSQVLLRYGGIRSGDSKQTFGGIYERST